MENRTFYRLANTETNQGLWYDSSGNFTGLIHNKFNFCLNNELLMDYDEEVRGYLSATDKLDTLWNWFTKDDIIRLQNFGYVIHVYESQDFKCYEKFQHWLINQETSKIIEKIKI